MTSVKKAVVAAHVRDLLPLLPAVADPAAEEIPATMTDNVTGATNMAAEL